MTHKDSPDKFGQVNEPKKHISLTSIWKANMMKRVGNKTQSYWVKLRGTVKDASGEAGVIANTLRKCTML